MNQVLGDGIMALFGVPIAHEDYAARLLRGPGHAGGYGAVCRGAAAMPGVPCSECPARQALAAHGNRQALPTVRS